MAHEVLDCRGLSCPMPIVRVSQKVKTMQSGDTLEVLASDLAFKPDLEAWSRKTGHSIEEFDQDDSLRAVVRIGG